MSQHRFFIWHADLKKPTRVKYDPEGWNTGGKTRKRDLNWHGVFFEYSPRLKFVKDGRELVAYFYEQYGIEAELVLIVQDYDSGQHKYITTYTGRFNLTQLEITELYAECNVEQSGFIQKFKNRQDVKVNLSGLLTQSGKAIEANTNETEDIELHSKVIRKLHSVYFDVNPGHLDFPDGVFGMHITPAGSTAKFIQFGPEGIDSDELEEWFNEILTAVTDIVPVNQYKIAEAGSHAFDFRFEVSVYRRNLVDDDECRVALDDTILELNATAFDSTANLQFYIQVNDDTPVAFDREDFVTPIPEIRRGSTIFTYNGTLDLNVDDIITIYADITGYFWESAGGAGISEPDKAETLLVWGRTNPFVWRGELVGCQLQGYERVAFGQPAPSGEEKPSYQRITADTTFPATTAPVVMIHEAFARVVESITDEPDSFRSEYFGRTDSEPTAYDADGEGSLRGVISGSLVRGFPLVSKQTSTSFKELIDAAKAIDGVGVGVELEGLKQRIKVAPLTEFYKPQRVVQFNFVKDIRKTVADEFYFNELEGGYDRWNNERQNNLDEFCTKREFTLPITQVKSKLVLRSPLIASGYTIEFTRRDRYVDGTSKDNDRDNDNFIIQLRRDDGSYVTDKDEDFAELNNLISPETVYNAKLSVMRNLLRNRMIRAGLFHQENDLIKLAFGEGNIDFTSRLNTETEVLSEKEIEVSKLLRPLWIPEYYFFNVKPTREQNNELDLEPYGLIEFSTTDNRHKKGYLMETTPEDESGLTRFKVLRANL